MLNNIMKNAICQHCSNLFIVKAGCYGKFCSLSCGTSFRNKIKLEKVTANYNLNPVRCGCCQTIIEYTKRKNKYCSNSCASKITNKINRKRGPSPAEKFPYSTVKFILCRHTNRYYSNRNTDGSIRRCSPYVKTAKEKYYSLARFKFNVYHYPEEFDLSLIHQHGWYTCPGKKRKNQSKNINGVSRDHIISVSYGFNNRIDPYIISHPANCQIILHSENKKKSTNCKLTVNQLLKKISDWDKKYTQRCARIELASSDWKSEVLPFN